MEIHTKKDLLSLLKLGVKEWNAWRHASNMKAILEDVDFSFLIPLSSTRADLEDIDFSECILSRSDFTYANLSFANLRRAVLEDANLSKCDFDYANLVEAYLEKANCYKTSFSGATLCNADFSKSDCESAFFDEATLDQSKIIMANLYKSYFHNSKLRYANLHGSNLREAEFNGADITGADITGADLSSANLTKANFAGAKLTSANLQNSILVETNLVGADLSGAKIYGISAWNLEINNHLTIQDNLLITTNDEPAITVDNLEVAQFVYLLLNNEKIRNVIDTIGEKGVLILGRFTQDRKAVLDAIRDRLRELGFVPMMFDFEKPTQRDFTETIKTLAGLSRFIIADITNPKSSPLELQATMPDYMIPFVPIIQEDEEPFSMFQDLQHKYGEWVLDVLRYDSADSLLKVLDKAVVKPALKKADELLIKKAEGIRDRHVKDYM